MLSAHTATHLGECDFVCTHVPLSMDKSLETLAGKVMLFLNHARYWSLHIIFTWVSPPVEKYEGPEEAEPALLVLPLPERIFRRGYE